MSGIASFHVFQEALLPELLQAAAVTPRISPSLGERIASLFSRRRQTYPIDPFWDLLQTRATEQKEYGGSGWSFANLELVLPEGVSLLDGGRTDADAILLARLRETAVLFDHEGAQRLLERLQWVVLRPDALLAEIPEELGGDIQAAKAVVDALDTARTWLAAVRPGTLGLRTLG